MNTAALTPLHNTGNRTDSLHRRILNLVLGILSAAILSCVLASHFFGANANPTGLPPLVDLGPGQTYLGYEGGLYPGSSNVCPPAHEAAGRRIAQSIVPLDSNGNYDPNGKIVFLPVGISLTNGVWTGYKFYTQVNNPPLPIYPNSSFKYRAEADPAMNPKVILPILGITGDTRPQNDTKDPNGYFYTEQKRELADQGISPLQVQVAWFYPFALNNLDPAPEDLASYIPYIRDTWKASLQAMKQVYPNLKIVYVGTRHHPFFDDDAPSRFGPFVEPGAHDFAWGVKQVVADQINGDLSLNYDPAKGTVVTPWIAWGPYMWADAGIPRAYDGFVWTADDVFGYTDQVGNPIPPPGDQTHPSANGIYKQATLLLNQMKTDPTATPWFLKASTPPLNRPPTAIISASPTSGTAPLPVSFNGSSSSDADGSIVSYVWNFGDGASGSGATSNHTYASAGTYNATLTVTDNAGAVTTSNAVSVTTTTPTNQPPTVSLSTNGTSFTAPATITLTASASDSDGHRQHG